MGKKKPTTGGNTGAGPDAKKKESSAKKAAAAEAAALDIAGIFGAAVAKPVAPGALPAKKTKGGASPAAPAVTAVATSVAAAAGPVGVYKARPVEEAMTVSDDAFFAETSEVRKQAAIAAAAAARAGKKGGKRGKKGGADEEVTGTRGIEPGMRVITEDDLTRIHTTNPLAGTTENCPFDCDCCF
jgi:hypothetical protein